MGTRFGSRIHLENPPAISGSGGSCPTCPPTFIMPETVSRGDTIALSPMRLSDTIRRADTIKFNPLKLNETVSRLDAYRIPTMTIKPPETLQRGDLAIFTVGPLTAVSRSGSPDADDWGDAWTDATIGQTGVNHGNVNPLQCGQAAAGIAVQRAYIKINLTRFTGLTAIGGAHTFTFMASHSVALLAETLSFNCQGQAGNPFTESTIVQTNQPATPTAITRSFSVAAGAAQLFTVTFTDAEMNQLLGKWVLIVFIEGPALTTFSIPSREDATTTNRMTITFKATR